MDKKGAYCYELLDNEISTEVINDNPEEFALDVTSLFHCEFDPIDYDLFMGPEGNLGITGHSLINLAHNEKITFKDLRDRLLEFKENDGYIEARKILEVQKKIRTKKASLTNWERDRKLLIRMGLEDGQTDDFRTIISKNERQPYSQIFLIYSDTLSAQKERELVASEIKSAKSKKKYPEATECVKALISYSDYEVGIKNRPS